MILLDRLKPRLRRGFPLRYEPGQHERAIRTFFGLGRGASLAGEVPLTTRRNVILCFTNRCGSNWLAQALASTGLIGHADELLNAKRVIGTSRTQGLESLADYIRHISQGRATSNGTFAVKLGWNQLYFLARIGAVPGLIHAPLYLYARRRDRAAQALSLQLAQRSGRWVSYWNSGPDVEVDPFDISDEELAATIDGIHAQERRFDQFFRTFGITPVTAFYEDLQADLGAEIRRIVRELGLGATAGPDPSAIRVRRQRDERSEARLAAFHQAMGQRPADRPGGGLRLKGLRRL